MGRMLMISVLIVWPVLAFLQPLVATGHTPAPIAMKRSPPAVDIDHQPGHYIRRLHQISVGIFLQELGEIGITPVQYAALQTVANHPGIDQRTLARTIALDASTTGGVVDRLEARGWTLIEPLPDQPLGWARKLSFSIPRRMPSRCCAARALSLDFNAVIRVQFTKAGMELNTSSRHLLCVLFCSVIQDCM